MGRSRAPSGQRAFTDEMAAGIRSPQDLLAALEAVQGTARNPLNASRKPLDQVDPKLTQYLRDRGLDPPAWEQTDWFRLPGVQFGDASFFSNHPLLHRALRAAEVLVNRIDPARAVPAVGVVTQPTFNAAAVRFDPGVGGPARAMTVVVVHFHLFLIIADFAFFQAWFAKTAAERGLEEARKTVTLRQLNYIEEVREGLRTGSGYVPHTPPRGCEYDDLVLSSMSEGWIVAGAATLFVVLHEIAHIFLGHHDSSLGDGRSYEMFWMNDDPHGHEFEADAFATRHFLRLEPRDILPDGIQADGDQFRTVLVAAVTALFVSLNVLKPPGWIRRLLQPSTHPSPVKRGLRVLGDLGLSREQERLAGGLLRLSSIL